MKWPKILGKFDNHDVIIKRGPYGFYLNHGGSSGGGVGNISLGTDTDPNTLTLVNVIKLIKEDSLAVEQILSRLLLSDTTSAN